MVLEDLERREIYSDIGGLQLLSYVRMGWVPKFYDVDPAHLLTDTARDDARNAGGLRTPHRRKEQG